jgi:hypothetical protein
LPATKELRVAGHVVLLGDSIFDNQSYTQGQPDVVGHLREALPAGWQASLLAIDGSTTGDLADQLGDIPTDASRLIVSIGGNDALLNADLLNQPVASTREALLLFGQRAASFEASYRAALSKVLVTGKPTTVCTIYNGNLPEGEAGSARVALMLFNDAILRVAFALHLSVIDLRLVCSEPSDYANPIEPSGSGGRKIAEAIVASLELTTSAVTQTRVYAG